MNKGDNESTLWKKLIELGVFDDFYPHRVNASFRYLDVEKVQSFSLKDLMQKGSFVFSFLSLDTERDSSFAIMDIFRIFDRSGSGSVTIEEFVIGMMGKLLTLYSNIELLRDIAAELLKVDNRASELCLRLEKDASSTDKLLLYQSNLRALFCNIAARLRHPSSADFAANLTVDYLVNVFRESIMQAVHDSRSYFHISDDRIASMQMDLADLADYDNKNTNSGEGVTGGGDNTKAVVQLGDTTTRSVHATVVWNLNDPRCRAGGSTLHSTIAAHRRTISPGASPTPAAAAASALVQAAPVVGVAAAGMADVLRTATAAARVGTPSQFSDLDDLRDLAVRSPSPMMMMMLPDGSGGESRGEVGTTMTTGAAAIGGGGTAGGGRGDRDNAGIDPTSAGSATTAAGAGVATSSSARRKKSILIDNQSQGLIDNLLTSSALSSLGLEADSLEGLSALTSGNIDSSQLYLLQAAFRSLESFLTLPSHSPAAQQHQHQQQQLSSQQAGTSAPLSVSEYQGMAAAVSRHTELRQNVEYLEDSGSSNHPTGHATREEKEENNAVPILKSGFEFDLVQNLFETQDALRKTRMRMDILEMVQQEAMIGGSLVDIEDDEDEEEDDEDMRAATTTATRDVTSSTATGDETKFDPAEERIIADVERKYGNELTSFEGIMSELSALRSCLSERATTDYPLGHLLDRNVAIVALDDKDVVKYEDSGSGGGYHGGQQQVSGSATSRNGNVNINNNNGSAHIPGINNASSGDKHQQQQEDRKALPSLLNSMSSATKELVDVVRSKTQSGNASHAVLSTMKNQQEKLADYQTRLEQSEIARNEFISLTAELQLLRDKVLRHSKDEGQLNLLQIKNHEMSKHIKELEDQLSDSKARRKDPDGKSDSKKIHDLKTTVQQLELHKTGQHTEIERLQKENQRLKAAALVSEKRVKGALQDQMALHHQLQQLEEEAMSAKATITKLTREMEDQRISRGYREDADRKISELQREVHKRDLELAEAREEANLAVKYQAEITAAEKVIELLETNINDLSAELEKGSVAILQLDNYRDQLRVKTKETRDMSLHIHALENQLKDVPYLQTRYAEVQEELDDCKMKIEKLPGLLSEQARLRGSSRAAVKAMQEQDKMLSHLKNRVKQFERETALLKNDNRAMQDLEHKLKESNQEIKRLHTMVAESSNYNAHNSSSSGGGGGGGAGAGSHQHYLHGGSIKSPKGGAVSPAASMLAATAGGGGVISEEGKKGHSGTHQQQHQQPEGQYRKTRNLIRQSMSMAGAGAGVASSADHK